MDIKEIELSVTDEKRIVTGLVVSTEFIQEIEDFFILDYFTNKHLRIIAEWAYDYYKKYNKAPSIHIQDIFEKKCKKIKEAERELIEQVLVDLSKRYEVGDEINIEFLLQNTEQYFRKRELEITSGNISVLNEEGRLEEAEAEIERFNKINIHLDSGIYINPGDEAVRRKIYRKREEKEENFFSYTGDLGAFCGNIKKGDVIGITAPQKRGKSFLLTSTFNLSIMSKIRTVFFSIEMTDTEMLSRLDKTFVPSVNSPYEEGEYYYPSFDCILNQNGDCADRKSNKIVLNEEGVITPHKKHKVCTKCMHHKDFKKRERFRVTTYDQLIYRDKNDIYTMEKKMRKFNARLDRFARMVIRPKYSLSYDLLIHDLKTLESRHGFIPEMIIIDYVDILKIGNTLDDYRDEDTRWKLLQELAGEFQCAVITATQGNKHSHTTETIHTTDQAGFYGKGRHVNKMFGINQKPEEKENGIWRMGVLDSRDSMFIEGDTCMVLQDLKTGQMNIDSYWKNRFRRKY